MKFSSQRSTKRQGVILLVVIALLVLFSLVGIAFVIYAESQANTARIWREGETFTRPDADPELLLAYFLGQLIYDTDNPFSSMRGNSLARNMFGKAGSTVPYSGTGRVHTGGADDFYQINYTAFGGAPRNPDQFGSPNVPYTYPDFNNMYLAAVKAGDMPGTQNTGGAVLMGSWHRPGPQGVGFGSLDPSNPNWNNPAARSLVLRPLPVDHAGFPPPVDAGGDVKNIADSPGMYMPGSNPPQFAGNDSFWMDLGFPVMKSPDGRKFKPLFASLVVDLDNRLNVNIHGNIRGSTTGAGGGDDPLNGISLSDQGLGPWEVNPRWVLPAMEGNNFEARRLFIGGPNGTPGRYDLNFWGMDWHRLPYQYSNHGSFYSPINYDANYPGRGVFLPGFNGTPATSAFPYYNGNYDGGGQGNACRNHPLLYNFFMPAQSYYYPGPQDRAFPVASMEALLRYGDKGSPALSSDLFRCCPQSLAIAKTRRLITTHGFDVDQPGVMPWLWTSPQNPVYQYSPTNGDPYPNGAPIPFPPLGPPPANSEFNPNPANYWQAITSAISRINLNRTLTPYPPVTPTSWPQTPGTNGNDGIITDLNTFYQAQLDRQNFARDIFLVLSRITGAGDPSTIDPVNQKAQYDALRWLAQLAVNIVDYIDNDDYSTPFNWNPAQNNSATPIQNAWVFGTEQPRIVLNEVYAEVTNGQADMNAQKAQNPYKVKFWVELHNPLFSNGGKNQQGGAPLMTENSAARLNVPNTPPNNGTGGYAAYKVTITTKNQNLRATSNVTGDPDTMPSSTIMTEVSNYTPAPPPMMGNQPPPPPQPPQVDTNVVQPVSNLPGPLPGAISMDQPGGPQASSQGDNTGFYVLGPEDPFPGQNPPTATLSVATQAGMANGAGTGMAFTVPANGTNFPLPQYTVLLRRLACPARPPNNNPTLGNGQVNPNFNPYITVDYVENVAVNDAVKVDSNGPHMAQVPVAQRYSVGRNQPYAADKSQCVQQQPAQQQNQQQNQQPQHTLFRYNFQGTANGQPVQFPYDWITFIDRPLICPMELLEVSGYKPHELTQQFMMGQNPQTGLPTQKFNHLAPWFDPAARIYRGLEFFTATCPMQWIPVGGRNVGRMNINNMWDPEIFSAMADATGNNFFTQADVINFFNAMLQSRSPSILCPGPNDHPFRGMATPYVQPGMDNQYPNGIGIDDTFLRSVPNPVANLPPSQQKRLFELPNPPPEANGHPYMRYEFLKKVYNSFTTRSNVFAVWLTVGFFEVVDDSDPTRPPKLGQEIGRIANEHVRHRMFAVIDRSNLTVSVNPQTLQGIPGVPAPRPYFIPSLTAVAPPPGSPPNTPPGSVAITVPGVGGLYEGVSWNITPGQQLLVDCGQNQEVITVTGVSAAPPQITAVFAKPHASGFSISNAALGNPGPQPRFDMRNPNYSGVLRLFSIIE